MKKPWIMHTLLALIFLILGAGGAYFFQNYSFVVQEENTAEKDTDITSDQKDSDSMMVAEDQVQKDTRIEEIKELFSDKYQHAVEQINLDISKTTDFHTWGGVSFEGEIGGAMFLAALDQGEWVLVYDGQGAIPCSDIDPYNFPTDMVPECIDGNGSLIYR